MELKELIEINGGNMRIISGVYLFVLMEPKGPIKLNGGNTIDIYLVIFDSMKFYEKNY
jgi:hypothetical protein